MPLEQPSTLVHQLQEAPDVFDVGVRERVVVVPPVHPLAEPLLSPGELCGGPDHLLPAAPGELSEAVGLDLSLRVQAELPLHADLDPMTLAIEAVLVSLVESPHGLVPLEDVLHGPAPRRVDGEDLVRGHGSVEEAPLGARSVESPKALERLVALPLLE